MENENLPDDDSRMERKPWDEYFMDMARMVSERSTCVRRKVGCVVVGGGRRVLATGYNGVPSEFEHCGSAGCARERFGIPSGQRQELCRGLHAEQNAIVQCATSGADMKGSTVYCTLFPCAVCLKMLIGCGVRRIVYLESYPDELSVEMLRECPSGLPVEPLGCASVAGDAVGQGSSGMAR